MMLFALPFLQHFADDRCTGIVNNTFFGLVPWYKYLTPQLNQYTGRCEFTNFNNTSGTSLFGSQTSASPIFLITLAVIEDLIRVAALVAVGYIIYGGIQYVTSQGSPDATRKAQQTIINALIGLVLAIMATAIVEFIGAKLGG